MKIIVFTGKARAGKSTAAEYLVKEKNFIRLSFATPLKNMLSTLGLSYEQLYGDEKENLDQRFGCTPRYLMQTLGTEWGRKCIHDEIWVCALRRELSRYPDSFKIVLDDARFDNEITMARNLGAKIVKVVRPEKEKWSRGPITNFFSWLWQHDSEKVPKKYDHILLNNGIKYDLHNQLDSLCQ